MEEEYCVELIRADIRMSERQGLLAAVVGAVALLLSFTMLILYVPFAVVVIVAGFGFVFIIQSSILLDYAADLRRIIEPEEEG